MTTRHYVVTLDQTPNAKPTDASIINMNERQTLSVAEAAKVLGISRAGLYNQINAGTTSLRLLPGVSPARVSRFEVERLLRGEVNKSA